MDLLNRAYSQLYQQFRSMTPGSRLTAGLLAAAALIGAGYLLSRQSAAPDVEWMPGVTVAAEQLMAMEAAFGKAGLKGYEVRGTTIRVPRGQEPTFMAALADANALPPTFGAALNAALNAGGLADAYGPQRDRRMKVALQDTLSLIISSMPWVERAYVLYDIDAKPGGFKDKVITATACIKPAVGQQLDESRVSAIRYLIVGVVAGLKPENVAVSDLNNSRTWYGNLDDDATAGDHAFISLKRTYEQDLKAKILNALCYIPGATVELSVAMEPAIAARAKQTGRAADAAPQADRNPRRGETSTGPKPAPNTATILSHLWGPSAATNSVEPSDAATETQNTVERPDFAPGPTLARVSVGVPSSYFTKIWQQRNAAETSQPPRVPDAAAFDQIRIEESAKIQRHVAQLLPSSESGAKAADLVAVTTFQDLPQQEPPAPGVEQAALDWLRQSWGMLCLFGLAVASLFVLRSMVRREPAAATPAAEKIELPDEPAGLPSGVVPAPHARRFYAPETSPRDPLSALVQNDPDAAAGVLRSWIGQVS